MIVVRALMCSLSVHAIVNESIWPHNNLITIDIQIHTTTVKLNFVFDNTMRWL